MACHLHSQTIIKSVKDTLLPMVELTAEHDHQRLMEPLHITSLHPEPSGNPQTANSDESKANLYPDLPDPLKRNNGNEITSPEMRWKLHRIIEILS